MISMNARRFALAALLALGLAFGLAPTRDSASHAAVAQPETQFEVEKAANLAYRTDSAADPERHRLDIYTPKGQKNFPVLFFVHGGTWKSGSKNVYTALGTS